MAGKKTIFNIVISIVVIVAAVFAYRLFFPKAPEEAVVSPDALLTVVSPDSELEPSDEFLRILLSLEKIEFKTEVFAKLNQNNLRDFSTELPLKDPGRPNPFAPINPGEDRPVATSTGSQR